jgi:hypothetical protein
MVKNVNCVMELVVLDVNEIVQADSWPVMVDLQWALKVLRRYSG